MNRPVRRAFLVALTAFLAGCSGDGSDTPTNEIIPDFSIIGSGSQVQAFARLSSENFPSIRLPSEDALRVITPSQTRMMEFAIDPFSSEYYTTQLTSVDPDQPVNFSLDRGDGTDAPNSVVDMPFQARLNAPSEDAIVFTGATLDIAWEQFEGADVLTVVLQPVECPGTAFIQTVTGDPGMLTITVPPSILPSFPILGACGVDVRLERQRAGTLDPAYAAGGTIFARRFDSRRIFIAPPE